MNIIQIAGFRKCGTSFLHSLIGKNFRVNSTREKELCFCLTNEASDVGHFDWYLNKFNDKSKLNYLDGSTLASTHQDLNTALLARFENIYIILLLRDPAKRFYSAYFHMKDIRREKRDVNHIIEQLPHNLSYHDIVAFENSELEKAVKNKDIDSRYFNKDYAKNKFNAPYTIDVSEPLYMYKYLYGSFYSKHNVTSKSDSILFFEDLIDDPKKMINHLKNDVNFKIEQEDKFILPNDAYKNSSGSVKYYLDYCMSYFLSKYSFLRLVKQSIPLTIRIKLKETLMKAYTNEHEKMTEIQYNKLREILKDEYEYWFSRFPHLKDKWIY